MEDTCFEDSPYYLCVEHPHHRVTSALMVEWLRPSSLAGGRGNTTLRWRR